MSELVCLFLGLVIGTLGGFILCSLIVGGDPDATEDKRQELFNYCFHHTCADCPNMPYHCNFLNMNKAEIDDAYEVIFGGDNDG